MRKPNLFIVGAPKTGTTSLYHYLTQHPDVYMSKIKEPHFFCTDFRKENELYFNKGSLFRCHSLEDYLTLFPQNASETYLGEASTTYLYSDTAAEEIYKFNPDSKIVVILRNPIDLLHSWYYYIKFRSEETAKSFADALELEGLRKQDPTLVPNSVQFRRRVYYMEMVEFDKQIKQYYDFFGEDNVFIIVNKDMQENIRKVYADLLNFMDIEHLYPDFEKYKENRVPRNPELKRVIDNRLYWLKKYYQKGTGQKSALKSLYTFLISRKEKRPPLSEELRGKLSRDLKLMVSNTSDLIGKDLGRIWGI